MKFSSKNLLVTGGAGFIGSNFIEYILDKYDSVKVFNIDKLTYAGNLNNTKSFKKNIRYKFIKGCICDKSLIDNIFKRHKIDGVINFAAESHVDKSIVNPEIFVQTNIIGVYTLLHTCYTNWMDTNFKYKTEFKHAKFYQISTDEVYGSIDKGKFSESSELMPNSPYSASKASADMLTRSFNKTFGIKTLISRCSNNFGPNQHKEKFIPKIIENIKNKNNIPVYGDGKNIRDWIYVLDHCVGIEKVFNNGRPGCIYNIGCDNEISNLELINIIAESMGMTKKINKLIKFVPDRYGHDKRYSLDNSKIKKELGWTPHFNFKEVLNEYIQDFK